MRVMLIALLAATVAACGNSPGTPSNQPPTTGTITAKPAAVGLQAATAFTLTPSGVTDPDGDTLALSWDLGDGTTATGATATKTYSTAGLFTVKLTANDGHNPAAQVAQLNLTVRSLSGTWSGTVTCSTCTPTTRTVTLTLVQVGASPTGTCSDSHNGTGFQPITVQAFTQNTTTGSFTFTGNCSAGFAPFGMTYDPVADTFTVGNWDSPPYTGTLTRS